MSESKSASVVFTNSSYLAGQAQNTAENARSLAIGAQTTADGKNKIYRGSSIEDAPKSGVVVGDLFFSSNDLYRYDGTSWEQVVSDTTGAEIRAEVGKATSEVKSYSDSVKAQLEADAAKAQATADSITNYVQNSSGSSYLATLLNQSPSNASLSALVNGQVVSAINVSSSGDTLIAGKKIMLDGDVTIDGTAFASKLKATGITVDQLVAGSIDASKINVINLNANNITTGTLNGITINGSTFNGGKFVSSSSNATINNTIWDSYTVQLDGSGLQINSVGNGNTQTALLYSRELYLGSNNGTSYIHAFAAPNSSPSIGINNGNDSTVLSSDGITSKSVSAGNFMLTGHKMRATDNSSLYVTNSAGNNFDSTGSVGFQVWAGIGLGKSTIYTPDTDLYIQQGNVGPAFGQSYSSANKTTIHCQNVISQVANTVSSRLSVKTDITKVTYDRALAAVQGTEMYDYRYVSDDSGQHYVSGIIDDVNPDPQYHMDDMLINKERTARIDANLLGYHHVVLQGLLKKIDELQAELTELKSKEKQNGN